MAIGKERKARDKAGTRDGVTNMSDTDTHRFVLIMPPGGEFDDLRRHITSFLLAAGMKPISWEEEIVPGDRIAYSVLHAIKLADIVIVDVTGNNPNVLFEAGYALGAGTPILPIVQRTAGRVPSDIGGRLYLPYDPAKPAELSDDIKTFVLHYLGS
jgi:hypothetical protein